MAKKSKKIEDVFGPLRKYNPPPVAGSGSGVFKIPYRKPGNRSGNPSPKMEAINPYRWKPGQSGNPKGRPKSSLEFKHLAASKAELAFDIIAMAAEGAYRLLEQAHGILANPNSTDEDKLKARSIFSDRSLLDAAHAIIDRGHGKPTQHIETDSTSIFDDMTPDEVDDYIIDRGAKIANAIATRRAKKT